MGYTEPEPINNSLSKHPNFKMPMPEKNETQIAYALRVAAHLVSPPQFENEHNVLECTEVSKQILRLEKKTRKEME